MIDEKELFDTLGRMFNKDADSISMDTRLKDDLDANSQALFGVAALLQKLTGVNVAFADINNCVTVGDAVALVQK